MPEPPRPLSARAGQPDGDTEDAENLSAALAVQAAVIREQSGLLSRREKAVASAAAGLWECRLADEALAWSGGVYDLFGISRGSRLHRPTILDLYEPSSHRLLQMVRERAIGRGGRFRLDAEIVTAQGHRRWIRISAAVESEGGRPARIYGMKQDVTEEVTRLGVLSRRADRDALTGLANRHAFDERFSPARPALRDPPGALVLVDLDGFKQVNDSQGHAAGDLCLRHAAARLAAICADADLVARVGGDEFAVLLRAPADPADMAVLGRRIVTAIGRPIEHDGRTVQVGASVGIAGGGACPPAELFTRADAALYAAKAAGRNTVRIDGAEAASGPGAA